jgi:hypothetical protein
MLDVDTAGARFVWRQLSIKLVSFVPRAPLLGGARWSLDIFLA